jgi:hypothetical protein
MSVPSELNKVTNDLLLKYDENFNKLYNKKNVLNTGIMNKEELIFQNLMASDYKDKIIQSLKVLVVILILFAGLVIGFSLQKIQLKVFLVLSLLLFLIYMFILYYYIYHKPKVDLALISYRTAKKMQEWSESTIVKNTPKYQCPVNCPPKEFSGINSSEYAIQPYESPILDKQSSENVWLYGDQSMNLYNGSFKKPGDLTYTQQELEKIRPKPFFGGINERGATYYSCVWDGSSGSIGIPMNSKKDLFTTIPCAEMEGYKQKGRYICTGDPSTYSSNSANCSRV